MRYIYVCIIIFAKCATALATNWQYNRDDYSTRANPLGRGRSELQLVVDNRSFDSRKATRGGLQPLGKQFSQSISSTSGTHLREYDISVEQTKWTIGMLHGLTSNWTVGFRLPVVRELSEVKSRNYNVQKSGTTTSMDALAAKNAFADQPTFQAADQIQIGHMEFVGKYLVSTAHDIQASLLHEVRFPTGETSPTDLITNPTPGAEGYGIALGMVVDVWPTANWRTGLKINHSVNLNDEVQYRGQPDKEKKYLRNPGDESELGVLLEYNPVSRYYVSAGMIYTTRQSDQFADSVLEKNLELNRSERQVAEFGVGLLPPEGRRDFPAAAQLRYAILMDGKNTEASNALTVQTSITF